MRRGIKVLVTLVTLVLGVALFWLIFYFGMKNTQWAVLRVPTVQWDLSNPFPLEEYEAQLWLVMLVTFLSGFLLAVLLLVIPGWIKRGVERRRERRFISSLESELSDLRNLPITDPAPLEDLEEAPQPRGGDAAGDEELGLDERQPRRPSRWLRRRHRDEDVER